VTLTYSVLYLTLYLHKANRNVQHTLLAQQATILNSAVEPLPPAPEPPVYEVRKAGITEVLKDRWNREVEHAVRTVEETDWSAVREKWEKRMGNVWERVRNSETGKEVEDRFNRNVVGVEQTAKDVAKDMVTGEGVGEKRLLEIK